MVAGYGPWWLRTYFKIAILWTGRMQSGHLAHMECVIPTIPLPAHAGNVNDEVCTTTLHLVNRTSFLISAVVILGIRGIPIVGTSAIS